LSIHEAMLLPINMESISRSASKRMLLISSSRSTTARMIFIKGGQCLGYPLSLFRHDLGGKHKVSQE